MTEITALKRSPAFVPAAVGGILLAGALLVGVAFVALAPRAASVSAPAGVGPVQVAAAVPAAQPITGRLDSEYLRSIAAGW
jgi:hypothetical protein